MFLFFKSSLKFTIGIFLITIFLFSCSTPKSKLTEYGPVFENVMRSDTGAFRGLSLGEKLDSVKAKETAQPTEVDDNYLYYEYKLNDSIGSYNITYDFDESGLNEIQSDIFITNPANTDNVFAGFKKFFIQHYGEVEDHMGFAVWTVKSEKYGTVRINLSDESSDFTVANSPGKISLWIYPDKD